MDKNHPEYEMYLSQRIEHGTITDDEINDVLHIGGYLKRQLDMRRDRLLNEKEHLNRMGYYGIDYRDKDGNLVSNVGTDDRI